MKLQLYKDKRGEWRWRFKVINEIIAVPVKGYKSKIDCQHSISLLRKQELIFPTKSFFVTELDGFRCIAANLTLPTCYTFKPVWDEEKYDAMLFFWWNGEYWEIELYSTKVDVSRIAINREGGGNKKSASFKCKTLPFKLI